MNNINENKSVKFMFKGEPRQRVYLTGSFNEWDDSRMQMTEGLGGIYEALIQLSPGRYDYKFVVNGSVCIDPNCKKVVYANGSLSSVINVS